MPSQYSSPAVRTRSTYQHGTGTSSIVDEKTHQPLLSILSLIVETACKLHADGHRVVIVSSGAIGVGLRQMNLPRRPKHLPKVQALAAIGQCKLLALWDQLFGNLGQTIAQVLLTRNDIADPTFTIRGAPISGGFASASQKSRATSSTYT